MNLHHFQQLSTARVAQLVREAGSKVCTFLLNGTHRWTLMEYPTVQREQFATVYLQAVPQRAREIYQLIFDHGFETLITPSLDLPLLERGEAYLRMAVAGMAQFAMHPAFLEFYQTYGVRVRFYGEYQRYFQGTPYAYLTEVFEEITLRTKSHDRRRFFFGVLAHDPLPTVAELAVQDYQKTGQVPDKRTLITQYYGEHIDPVDLCIGFGKFDGFHVPLLTTGTEHLYFTVSPSAYLTQVQLREILYDHLYARPKAAIDYFSLSQSHWDSMRRFYQANRGQTLGVGMRPRLGMWCPTTQVILPEGTALTLEENNTLP